MQQPRVVKVSSILSLLCPDCKKKVISFLKDKFRERIEEWEKEVLANSEGGR